ncbi:MAG: NADH-quinone oxidoreductase subunit J [Chloroflexi bacterium]|nr:NADH-quinone oxidoreductase subunit J [Chloroflexota bacterium]
MELTLFVIIGAVAVISAAMMLISENAIYSTLFLILNFACIAFFFLMLNAPFLAMVQITVYAGAIMVLFLFVIMLLGAEQVIPSTETRFNWLASAVVGLALVFLVAVSAAIIDGKIEITEPQKIEPHVRVVNAMDGIPALDVYLDGTAIARDVEFHDNTRFKAWNEGRYTLALFAAGDDPQSDTPLVEQQVELNRGEALTFTAVGRLVNPGPGLVVVTEQVDYNEEKDTLRLIAVNGLPERALVDVLDESDSGNRKVLVDGLEYGKSAETEIGQGTYTLGLYSDGDKDNRVSVLKDAEFDANTTVLVVFTEQQQPDNSFRDLVINVENKSAPSFGGPTHVGRLLFSRYVLPFEMVGLLLLVAMIGAIVLTHETLAPRRRMPRRFANPAVGYEPPADKPGA